MVPAIVLHIRKKLNLCKHIHLQKAYKSTYRPLDISEDIAVPQKQITQLNIIEIMKLSATTAQLCCFVNLMLIMLSSQTLHIEIIYAVYCLAMTTPSCTAFNPSYSRTFYKQKLTSFS